MNPAPTIANAPSAAPDFDLTELLNATQAAKAYPPNGCHISHIYRLWMKGEAGITLRFVLVSGKGRCTTRKWILQYIAAVTAAKIGQTAAVPKPATAPPRRRLLRDSLRRGRP